MTTRGPLWRVSIETTTEAEEAITELLQEYFAHPASSYTDVETGQVTVMVYLSGKQVTHREVRPSPAAARFQRPTAENYQPARLVTTLRRPKTVAPRGAEALRRALQQITACGLNIGTGEIFIQKVRRQDWAESWKRHFKPIEITSALLIKPSWSKRAPKTGQAIVVLDPGLSFGTGQHPTTAFCLQQVVAHNQRTKGRSRQGSFLDIGTGSGILAIAAAKLGYAAVEAFDFDGEAVRIAHENARKNGVSRKLNIRRKDVTKMPRHSSKKYDLVCANLISTLLLAERRSIISRLKPGGTLVLAGILKSEFASVRGAYEACGLRLVNSRTEKEWRSGAFSFGDQ